MKYKLFTENFKVARQVACDGMVLLENDGILPLKNGTVIAPVGRGCFNFIKGGGGSADVYSPYVRSLIDGLEEKDKAGVIKLSKTARRLYPEGDDYSEQTLDEIFSQPSTAILTISRYTGEAFDIKPEKGTFYLSDAEKLLLDRLEKCEGVEGVIVVFNIAGIMDMSWLSNYRKIRAALIAWLPGMEGGSAVADILCGDVNPSGRLTDTVAADYYDYPASPTFGASNTFVRYEEDIFVGYRYFETFDTAAKRVIYPFGYGLSYSDFTISGTKFSYDDNNIIISAEVTNAGGTAGRQVLQVYTSSPDGLLEKPSIELRAFAKTKLLKQGEKCTLKMSFKISDMASFDDTGVTGNLGDYILETGVYEVFIGTNARDIKKCGSLFIEQDTVTERCGLKLTSPLDRRLTKSGEYKPCCINQSYEYNAIRAAKGSGASPVMLKDVADGKAEIDDFLAQLTIEELIELSHSQPPAFPRGTAGIGNMKKYGVPNAQTADGPLGLRKTVPTTAFPCSTLLACTWDEEMQFKVGAAIGYEGISTKVDILLAPGLNIHRDPLCGRNFEYYSEDPVVSGRTAAAFVRGVQSQGMLATIKHFFGNNKEENRFFSDSLMSERAAREIYLKGFRIAIELSNPAFLMTSYNLVNGTRPNENYNLMTSILRGEWGFEGAVMTDWRVPSHQWREIKAGNNVKMPFGYPEELALTAQMVNQGKLTRAELENNVRHVLCALMKTDRFRRQDMGNEYVVYPDKPTVLSGVDFTGVSGTWVQIEECKDEGGGFNLGNCCKDFHDNDIHIIYDLDIIQEGVYDFYARVATPHRSSWLEMTLDNEPVGRHDGDICTGEGDEAWQTWTTVAIKNVWLPSGKHTLRFYIHDDEKDKGISVNRLEIIKV